MRRLNDNKQFLDDFARLATGAVGALSGFRSHLKQEVKTHLDRFLIELDLVPRADFEIVEQMAKQARLENAALTKRIATLEAQLKPTKPVAKKATTKVTKPVKTTAKPKTKKATPKPSKRKA